MLKTLAASVREYKKPALLTPVYVIFEVILDCIIPFLIAELVNRISAGAELNVILGYGGVLAVMALLSLLFGTLAAFHALTRRADSPRTSVTTFSRGYRALALKISTASQPRRW